MLFLLAAGLTLVFGIMDMINLAHGSLYMIGAYLMASFVQATGSFWLALPLALVATALVGAALEVTQYTAYLTRTHRIDIRICHAGNTCRRKRISRRGAYRFHGGG